MTGNKAVGRASVEQTIRLPVLVAFCAMSLAVYLLLRPPPSLTPQASKAAAMTIFAIGFWASGVLPQHLTALVFFLFSILLAAVSPGVLFSGFASAAFWLLLGGMIIGTAVKRTGLGDRIAGYVARGLKDSYIGLISRIVAICVLLSFLMPATMGRVVLLIPIAQALAEHFGFSRNSKGRTGVILTAAFCSQLPSFAILPANVPNMIFSGVAEGVQGVTFRYGEYLLLHFPVLGILKSLLFIVLIVFFFPDHPRTSKINQEAESTRMSSDERKLFLILMLSLALWITDFLHHISPAWVALGAGVYLLLPRLGLLPSHQLNEHVNFAPLFYVAAILGLCAMVAQSGLGDFLAKNILEALPLKPGAALGNYYLLSAGAALISVATTIPGVPVVLTPLADEISRVTGLPIQSVLMTQVLGFSTFFLPYQSPPLVVALSLGEVPNSDAIKVSLTLAAATLFILIPINFLWWRILGWI